MDYNSISSELAIIISENDSELWFKLYDFLEYYLKETYPNISKQAYCHIIDQAVRIYKCKKKEGK